MGVFVPLGMIGDDGRKTVHHMRFAAQFLGRGLRIAEIGFGDHIAQADYNLRFVPVDLFPQKIQS